MARDLALDLLKDTTKEVGAEPLMETTSNSMNGAEEDANLSKKKKKKKAKKNKSKGEEQSSGDHEHVQDSKPEGDATVKKTEFGRQYEWT
jgi:hypothetical protein